MHELSVATAIVNTACKHAGGRAVKLVHLRVGKLRQVVPDSLTFYWEIVARDTECDGARLQLEEIEARLHCASCGRSWEPLFPAFRCPECGSATVEVVAGDELAVEYIEVEDQEAACIAPK
jgi:hydrogenase nickel incorporation protein HypA/HybF